MIFKNNNLIKISLFQESFIAYTWGYNVYGVLRKNLAYNTRKTKNAKIEIFGMI